MSSAVMARWVVDDLAEKLAVALVVGTLDSEGRQVMPAVSTEACRKAALEAVLRASTVALTIEESIGG